MIRAIALALLLAADACQVERPTNAPADPPPGADQAQVMILEAWSAALLPAGRALGDPPPVLWFEGPCLEYGGECDDVHNDGATLFVPGDVEIHLIARPLVSDTALAHELLHWSLHEVRGEWDGSHAAVEWGMVPVVTDELQEGGL